MCPFRQFHYDCISCFHVAAFDHNRHNACLADEAPVRIPPEHCRYQASLKCFNLSARVAKSGDFDHGFGSEPKSRTAWQSEKVDAARCHVFADSTRLHIETGSAKLVEQFLVQEMHLPQVWRVWIFQDARAMLYLFAHVCIPFNAEARDEADHWRIGFAKCVALAAAHRGDDGGHVTISTDDKFIPLFWPNANGLDHLTPLLGFLDDELCEVGR
jgi:hypothetical protein